MFRSFLVYLECDTIESQVASVCEDEDPKTVTAKQLVEHLRSGLSFDEAVRELGLLDGTRIVVELGGECAEWRRDDG